MKSKKVFLIAASMVFTAVFGWAKPLPISAGGNIGTNMESSDGYAMQFGIHGDYEIIKNLKIGIQFNAGQYD